MFGHYKSEKSGFTIVELLVVIVVIGILAAVTIVAFNGVSRRAQVATIQSDLRNALTTLRNTYTTNDAYPTSTSGLTKSTNTNFEYSYTTTSFCLTATSTQSGIPAYYISDTVGAPTLGACPGHTDPGSVVAYVPPTGTVEAFAGSAAGNSGNADGAGTVARFLNPNGIVATSDGTIYVADTNNQRIRKILPDGTTSTIAGSVGGYLDSTTATSARFNGPTNLALATDGTIYVADSANHRIRKITTAGAVETFAGSGTAGFLDATGAAAQFNSPKGIAVGTDGNIYVADSSNNRIRKITPAGVVTTLAGSGAASFANGTGTAAQFRNPLDISVAPNGSLYVVDSQNQRIRNVTMAGVATTFVGSGSNGYSDGTGTAAELYYPAGMTVTSDGTLYIAEGHRIRKVTAAGVVSVFAGSPTASGLVNGQGTAARFYNPFDVASAPNGSLYVADTFNSVVRKIK